MTVLTRIGRAEVIGMIENGCIFKFANSYYIATTDNNKEQKRICVNVESGEVETFATGTVVETFDNATIDITGRG